MLGASQAAPDAVIRPLSCFPKGLPSDRPSGSSPRLDDAPSIAIAAAPAMRMVGPATQSFQGFSAAC